MLLGECRCRVCVPQHVRNAALNAYLLYLALQINSVIRATPGLEDKTIGYMNPFLYWAAVHYPKAFNDITEGYIGYTEDPDMVNDIVSPFKLAIPIRAVQAMRLSGLALIHLTLQE